MFKESAKSALYDLFLLLLLLLLFNIIIAI